MEIDPALIIVVIGSVGGLLIERFFYYRSKYKEKKTEKIEIPNNPGKSENPSHGERLMGLETDVENLRENNKEAHELMRKSIDRLSTQINGLRRPGK